MRDTVGYLIEEGFRGAPRISETAEKFGGSKGRNHTLWNVGYGVDLPIFEFFETNPVRMTRFFGVMDNIECDDGYNIKHLVNGRDCRTLGKGMVIDVGGSTAYCSLAIAEVAPELKFIVEDLEKVIEGSKERTKDREVEELNLRRTTSSSLSR